MQCVESKKTGDSAEKYGKANLRICCGMRPKKKSDARHKNAGGGKTLPAPTPLRETNYFISLLRASL